MSASGIKETKEALIAFNEVTVHLIKLFKNGFCLSTVIELWNLIQNDKDFKEKLYAAYEGYQKIPSELAALDLAETMELVYTEIAFIPQIIESIRSGGQESPQTLESLEPFKKSSQDHT